MGIRNQRILMGAIAFCLLLAFIFFYFNNIKIPKMKAITEARIRAELDVNAMPSRLVAVVTAPEGVSLYTEMTEEVVNATISLVEIPDKYIVEGGIENINQIKGMITKHPLNYGQQLLLDQFYTEENWYGEMERLKEFPVSSIVADEVKSGNIIDMIINYGNGDYDVVVSKTKVRKVMSNEPQGGNVGQEDHGYTVVLAVDETQYRDLQLAQELGKLETRLYLDTNQTASLTTFDYQKQLKQLRLDNVATKGIGSMQKSTIKNEEEKELDEDINKERTGNTMNYRP
ncbi:CpaB family protein [Alkaliphilus hydrothermalis]|uniref:Lipopolysaccharide export LptBFGC system permease protein LptF n=1 Tax=Alkaliphilus hydrothermalis TaxID=1482730 RepID=A0ABS2NKX2_9FIRM|nr:hypothetical protein [Alkaliphilus hydrothermalis]MBM7613595.1 lipopolysaccharide export LptBFGC system permease protein LptF [Alkaliphilus hydrothermalis]